MLYLGLSGDDDRIITSENYHKKALELCESIVTDHVSGKRTLRTRSDVDGTTDGSGGGGGSTSHHVSAMSGLASKLSGTLERMKRILNERIRWNRANSQARSVIVWTDLLLRLLQATVGTIGFGTGAGGGVGVGGSVSGWIEGTDAMNALLSTETDEIVLVQLQKVYALLELGETTSALKLAQATAQQMQSTRTLVMAFLAGMFSFSPLLCRFYKPSQPFAPLICYTPY